MTPSMLLNIYSYPNKVFQAILFINAGKKMIFKSNEMSMVIFITQLFYLLTSQHASLSSTGILFVPQICQLLSGALATPVSFSCDFPSPSSWISTLVTSHYSGFSSNFISWLHSLISFTNIDLLSIILLCVSLF